MKPFSFHTLLEYRKRQEDTARLRLSEARRVAEAVAEKLRVERESLAALIARTEAMQREGINILDLMLYEEQIVRAGANILAIEKNLRDKTELVRQEQQHLLRRARDRRVMERLKERQNAAYKEYLDRKEQAVLDEIAITRYDSSQN